MSSTKIRGNTQIMSQTLDIGRLELDFLGGSDWDITNGTNDAGITGVRLTPVADDELASKYYVDSIAAGLTNKTPVRMATTINLTATYDNGTNGVGATLTNSGTQAALTLDGITAVVDDRVLVKNQSGDGVAAVNSVTADTQANMNENGYFWIFTSEHTSNTNLSTAYYCWIDKGTGSDPAPASPEPISHPSTVGVQIDISGSTTAQDVSDVITSTINALDDFSAANGSGTSTTVTITNAQTGYLPSITDGAAVSGGTSFTEVTPGKCDCYQNGAYVVTSTGSASTNWILTRADDYDNSPLQEIRTGDYFFVTEGDTQANNGYAQTHGWNVDGWDNDVGYMGIEFSQVSGAGQIIAGDGLDKDGNTLSVDVTDIIGEGLTETSNNIDISWGGTGSATTVARSDHNHDGTYATSSHDHSGTYTELAFKTIDAPTGTDPVATLIDDTLTLATGGPLSIDGGASNTITFDIVADGILNEHINWGGTGETAIDALDIPLDTSTGTYAGSATTIQDALEELESSISSSNKFSTIAPETGDNAVADTASDTLTLTGNSGSISVTGSSDDVITFGITADGVDNTHISWGHVNATDVDATDVPVDVTNGTYGGAALTVQDALEEIEANNIQFKTFVPTTGNDVIADNATDTLTITSDNGTIVVTGDGTNDELDFDIATDGVDNTHISWGHVNATDVDATDVPVDVTNGTYAGSAITVQDALEELETSIGAIALSGLSDTDIDAAAAGDILFYNAAGEWTDAAMNSTDFILTGTNGSETVALRYATTFTIDSANPYTLKASDLANTTNGKGASIVGIEDSATYFTATDVEGVLAEIGATLPGFGTTLVVEELPTVTDSSANVTLNNTPATDTLRVFLNGLRQIEGASYDYTISGTTITFAAALSTGDQVSCDYEY